MSILPNALRHRAVAGGWQRRGRPADGARRNRLRARI